MCFRPARGDDSDDFFLASLKMRVDDKQNRSAPNRANGDPSLLLIRSGIAHGEGVRIVEHEDCRFETNAVLSQVISALFLVPFKSHEPQQG